MILSNVSVIPAKAGIQRIMRFLDPRLRGGDTEVIPTIEADTLLGCAGKVIAIASEAISIPEWYELASSHMSSSQ